MWLLASAASAAGLGSLSVLSGLGQPLRAEIELVSVQPDDLGAIEAKLANADAFRRAHMERSDVLSDLQLTVVKRADGQPVVRVTSTAPVSEPFVDLLIELNWSSGRILREYTLLLDPVRDQKPMAEAPQPVRVPVETSVPAAPQPVLQKPPFPGPAKQAAAKPAQPTTYGPVKAGETLHGIAQKVLLPDVTVEMMVASLYQANKGAFSYDNANLLQEGKVLTVPDRESVMLMFSPSQARQLLRKHTQAWHEIRDRIASAAARKVAEASAENAGKGKITAAKPEQKPESAGAAKDVLKVSKGEPGADAKAAQRVQSLEEELAAKNHALQEAQQRVGQLERTVQDLQRLLDLKAKQGAATQVPAEAKADKPKVAVTPPPEKAKPAMPAPTPEAPSFIQSLLASPLYIGGVIAAAVLVVLLWVFMAGSRRRKGLSDFEQSVMTGGDPFKTSVFKTGGDSTGGATTTQSGMATEFSRLGLGSIDAHEVDPIAEAEVYMAYGRDAQAEEILKEALAKDASRHDVSLKLLEIYAARQDRASFETLASELYAGLGDPASPVWQKASELGRAIDPENPLYRAFGEVPDLSETLPEAAAAEEDVVPEAVAVAMVTPDANAELASEAMQDLTPAEDLAFDQTPEPEAETVAEAEPESVLDFDDLSLATEEPVAQAGTDSDDALAFPGLGTGFEPAAEAVPAPAETSAEIPEDLGLLDLSLADHQTDEPQPGAEVENLPDLDFSGIDLELAESESVTEAQAPAAEPAEAPEVIEVPEEIDADLLEEVNTKLDLARAYMEMGDKEGAREILDEVLKEGSVAQRQEADRLVASL